MENRDDSTTIKSSNDQSETNDLYKLFTSLVTDQMNVPDVNAILDTQRKILLKLDSTNKNLTETSQISMKAYSTTGLNDLQTYISILNTMKQDLDFIFKRIRIIKHKLEIKYPEKYLSAFSLVRSTQVGNDDTEDDELDNTEPVVKERTESNESASSAIAGLIQTARNRISSLSGKDLVNNILNSAQLNTNSSSSQNSNSESIQNDS